MSMSYKVLAAAGLAACVAAGGAVAQEFPSNTIRIVVPFAAGTTTDIVARNVGAGMSENLGVSFAFENRAGAGGSVGTYEVVTADPDGYTLSMGTVGTLAINATVFSNLPYDPQTDVTPIAFIGYTPTLLVVSAESGFETLQDLVAAAETENGVTFASAGNGTSGHLAGELVSIRSGGNMIHVPFSSGAEGLTSVLSGEVDFMFYHPVAALPYLEAGSMRALGVSGAAGSSVAPDVPPLAETYEGFDLIAWFLLAGPAGMDEDVARRLHDAAVASLASEPVRELYATSGLEFGEVAFEDLRGFIANEVKTWGEIAADAGATLN
jgi:tripartite-type tricarboxylate transporter receptor subunit TctC